ncbi:hypothetical protein [Achromobacter sp.]|uniref:hypothetical protein n=1 Tax=Achromobacter sp. TaxID=134375 RepID=UPI00257D0E90|nr:hypothetical protein [Achromobacter sp.]
MSSEDRYSYKSYMGRLLNLLLASGPSAAVLIAPGIAATLGSASYVFGFACEDPSQEEFDFDASTWNDTSWDGETHAETWSIFVAPTIFTRWP